MKYCNQNFFLFQDDLNNLPYRGQRLERARNLIIETIKQNSNLINCDLFIMLDFDDMGTYRIDEKNILDAIQFLFSKDEIAAVFANQLGTYYDIWTLRDEKYCQNDFCQFFFSCCTTINYQVIFVRHCIRIPYKNPIERHVTY